jgi:hypothetical protein
MPGLLKVGFSAKDPHLRARELNHTGSPRPYVVEYDALVRAPREIEQRIHETLRDQREGKEWFRCSLSQAIAATRSVASERISESYRDKPAVAAAETKQQSVRPASMPRARPNGLARWRWSERTQSLAEKVGSRSFGPGQYTYEGAGQIKGFAIRDRQTPWIAVEDVEFAD